MGRRGAPVGVQGCRKAKQLVIELNGIAGTIRTSTGALFLWSQHSCSQIQNVTVDGLRGMTSTLIQELVDPV